MEQLAQPFKPSRKKILQLGSSIAVISANPSAIRNKSQINLYSADFRSTGADAGEFFPNVVDFEFEKTIAILAESYLRVGFVVIDSRGNRSPEVIVDFSKADPGGPTLKTVSYMGGQLKIKGKRLSGQLSLEVNGEVVATFANQSAKKLRVTDSPAALELVPGSNRIRVLNGALRSNLFILDVQGL
jgi:hypothetical protein